MVKNRTRSRLASAALALLLLGGVGVTAAPPAAAGNGGNCPSWRTEGATRTNTAPRTSTLILTVGCANGWEGRRLIDFWNPHTGDEIVGGPWIRSTGARSETRRLQVASHDQITDVTNQWRRR